MSSALARTNIGFEESKYFLLGNEDLNNEEWKHVWDSVVANLKTEVDISWYGHVADRPSVIVLIWETC